MLKELLQDKEIFPDFSVTIGLGKDYGSAFSALQERLVSGSNQILTYEPKTLAPFDLKEFSKEFLHYVEINDDLKLLSHLKGFLGKVTITGQQILDLAQQIFELYQLSLKKYHFEYSLPSVNQLLAELDNLSSEKEVYHHLAMSIFRSFQEILEQKENAESKPITLAKKYINQNFAEPITLEIVSQEVGFSSAYFSTMFKAKTGESFTEYLFRKRMEEAKRQLRDTKTPIAEICENVGYLDLKHFNKYFKKSTGLQPKEYRKLYS